jgi:hypothetical protein
MTDTAFAARVERLLDRTEIFDLVRFERLCRDQRDFTGMVACYVPNAPVRTPGSKAVSRISPRPRARR